MNHFAKIAEKLSAYELDGMLLTCEANRFYASGFHSTGTDGVALVTREGNFYFTDSRYIEAAHNKVQDAEIAMTDAAHPYVDLINAAMEKTHVQKLGFEDAYMTVADYRHYSEKLHCQLVPATELLISLRQSKDEEEIQRMIAAQRIAEGALDQIVKEIKPGVTEKEIAARLQYLMLAGGAENMSFDPIVASGPNGSMPHAVPTDRKIQDGDFVTMDFGCIYQGYCSDMTRTVAVGHVTEEMEKVYNVVLQAQLAGIAAAKAGATGHDVDAAARKVIEDAGYGPYFGHSFGHAIEKASGYAVGHGAAVAAGMVVACRLSETIGLCSAETTARLRAVLRACGLPDEPPYPPASLVDTLLLDKKRSGDGITFVFCERPGRCLLRRMPFDELRALTARTFGA